MVQAQHLRERIERAERLARSVLDLSTIDRLQAYTDECRKELTSAALVAGKLQV